MCAKILKTYYTDDMKIDQAKYIHFIGIGGIGTSSLAQILFHQNKKISGSDFATSEITNHLSKRGMKVTIGHNQKNVSKHHQLIIYSSAIPKNNPELEEAEKLKIKTISYPEALGELSKNYFTIAIAGTHGKSTTTALTALCLIKGDLDPTVIIGTKLKELKNQNYRVGKSKYLVVEACEYKRAFLNLSPDILIITNLEADHLDYYKDLKDYQSAFKKLCQKIPKTGAIIINKKDKNSVAVSKNIKAKIYDFSALKLSPGIPGDFNLRNAAAAAKVAELLDIPATKTKKAIKSYKGSWRRLEYKKTKLKPTIFIDDYGHHPTEIKVTLKAIREKYPDKKILCIFQPHQYSRTHLLLKEFAKSFHDVNELIIPNIYRVRDTEEDLKKISTDKLVEAIKKHTPKTSNGQGLENTAEYIKINHKKYDVIVTMGAGDINKIYKLI